MINFSVSLPKEGSYILEIVRQDGIAHVNVPLIRGNIWSIIDIVNDQKTRIIRKNTAIVQSFVLESINNLRKKVQRNPVVLDPTLTRLAQAKVDDMISRNYQAHADPDGKYIDSLAQKLNIDIE